MGTTGLFGICGVGARIQTRRKGILIKVTEISVMGTTGLLVYEVRRKDTDEDGEE